LDYDAGVALTDAVAKDASVTATGASYPALAGLTCYAAIICYWNAVNI